MKHQKSTQFNCFSPPVMIATLAIEVALALYSVWRFKLNTLGKLIVITLAALATFQLAEYYVCTGIIGHQTAWSRIGFVAITALPPLGLHIIHQIAGKPSKRLLPAAYATMGGFMTFFLLYPSAFIGQACTGNYVIFQIGYQMGGLYATYYYGWLLAGMILAYRWSQYGKDATKMAHRQVQALQAMIIGYLVFLVPTAIANTVAPATRSGIPSVMCGFAVLFALILALYVLPRTVAHKSSAEAKAHK